MSPQLPAAGRGRFYPQLTAGGTSAQHFAAYKKLSWTWSPFIPTSTLGGRESYSRHTREDSRAQRAACTCSGPERAHPPFAGEHHTPGRGELSCPAAGSRPPATMVGAPGRRHPRRAWHYVVVFQVAAFTPSPLAAQPQTVVQLCGHPGLPPLGPEGARTFHQVFINACLRRDFKYM